MVEVSLNPEQIRSLKAAIARNPVTVKQEAKRFLIRGLAVFKAGIFRDPWRIGGPGGGAPVASGQLMRTHETKLGDFEASIYPTQPYAPFVHQGTSRMMPRPWLDYVSETSMPKIDELEVDLLNKIVTDLAS